MKKLVACFALSLVAGVASAFPTWIGVYGSLERHTDSANPGTFTVLMNQDYYGLRAEVGIQMDNGSWTVHPMVYSGRVDGNSKWTFAPAVAFPAGSTVKYYFHGYDNGGGNIWDSRNGQDYSFAAAGPTVVTRIADGKWFQLANANGITWLEDYNLWVDFKVRNLGAPTAIGIVWTWDNWTSWKSQSAVFEGNLDGGFQQWGADVVPMGSAYSHRSLGFIRWFPPNSTEYMAVTDHRVTIQYAIFCEVNGAFHWDNNGGQNYTILIEKP